MIFKSTPETAKYLTSTPDTDPPFKAPYIVLLHHSHVTDQRPTGEGGLSNFPTGSRGATSFLCEQEGGVTFSIPNKFHPAPCHVNNEHSLI